MTDRPIKSLAGHVLATGEATDEEAQRLAAYALGDDPTPVTGKSREDLERILAKAKGQEGQTERVRMIEAELARTADEE